MEIGNGQSWPALREHAKRNRITTFITVSALVFIVAAYALSLLRTSLDVLWPLQVLLGGQIQLSGTDQHPNDDAARLSAFAALFTIFVLAITAGLSMFGYQSIRQAQVREKTLSFIEKTNEDKDIFELFEQLRYVRYKYDENIQFELVYAEYTDFVKNEMNDDNRNDGQRLDYDYIVHLLNFYETWALGVRFGSLDEAMLADFWRRPLIVHWAALVEFVYSLRIVRNDPAAYELSEQLANRWALESEREIIDRKIADWRKANKIEQTRRGFFGVRLFKRVA